eukprot:1160137-Pelagomonas_calceolata.AAC.4
MQAWAGEQGWFTKGLGHLAPHTTGLSAIESATHSTAPLTKLVTGIGIRRSGIGRRIGMHRGKPEAQQQCPTWMAQAQRHCPTRWAQAHRQFPTWRCAHMPVSSCTCALRGSLHPARKE